PACRSGHARPESGWHTGGHEAAQVHGGMNTANDPERKCNERPNDPGPIPGITDPMFRLLFERSADAMSLFDPATGRFIESNEAVAQQTGAPNKEALGNASPVD